MFLVLCGQRCPLALCVPDVQYIQTRWEPAVHIWLYQRIIFTFNISRISSKVTDRFLRKLIVSPTKYINLICIAASWNRIMGYGRFVCWLVGWLVGLFHDAFSVTTLYSIDDKVISV
jgi:hypothetical protein